MAMNLTRGSLATSAAKGGLTTIMPTQRAGEKPLEILHPAGDSHLVADRPENIIGEKTRKIYSHDQPSARISAGRTSIARDRSRCTAPLPVDATNIRHSSHLTTRS